MTRRPDVEELRGLFLFEDLAEERLAWLAERAEVRTFVEGATVYREGQPADALWVLVEGGVRMTRMAAGEDVTIVETSHVGAYAGAVRAFVEGAEPTHFNSMTTTADSRVLRLASDDFSTLVHESCPMAVHLLDGLYVGIRNSEATIRQREHLAQLGTLSAHLAHELNNPAAAAVRATGQLRSRVAGMRHKLAMLADGGLDPVLMTRLVQVQESTVERAAKSRRSLSALEESDLEDAISDALDDVGATGSYELAPVFAAAGLDTAWVGEIAEAVGDSSVDAAFRWLSYTLETEALMDEIEDASTRISTLVGSVKQYSHMGGATQEDIDVHPGIDSTLVMLGHKLAAVEVRRDYDVTVPRVPAHAAELNQVWTNLIVNAVDAMGGRGVLTLRTRRDEDSVVVSVTDTGPGIPDGVRERMFEAFFTTKAAGEGSGLGLDNARRIVEKGHHGAIEFVTGPGGTTFEVRLPASARVAQPVA